MAIRPMDEFDFNLKEDDEYLNLLGRQLVRRVLHDARIELQNKHLAHKNKGELVRVLPDRDAVTKLILESAQKALNPGVSD